MIRFTFILLFISTSAFSQSLQWLKGIGGEGYDQANCVAVDSEKNVIVSGTFTSEVDFNPDDSPVVLNAGVQEHFFVAKYNPAGEMIWVKHIEGNGRPNSIHLDQDENIFIVGSYEETIDFDPGIEEYMLTSTSTQSGFIQKLNIDGNFIWAKSLEGVDDISDLKINSSGDLLLTGWFYGTADFDPGPETEEYAALSEGITYYPWSYILKLNESGSFEWVKILESNTAINTFGIAVDSDNNIYCTGGYKGEADLDPGISIHAVEAIAEYDIFIVKLTDDGSFIWGNEIKGLGTNIAYDIDVDNDNSIYLTGMFSKIADFDGSEEVYMVYGGLTLNVFVTKLDADGNLIWANQAGNNDRPCFGRGLDVSDGKVFICGRTEGLGDFNPSPDDEFLLESDSQGGFIQILSSDGEFMNAYLTSGVGPDECTSIAVFEEAIYAVGHYSNALSSDIYDITSNGLSDIFIIKYGVDYAHIEEISKSINLFPNPAYNEINVQIDGVFSYKLYDLMGKVVLSGETQNKIDLLPLNLGNYYLMIEQDNSFYVEKIVIL